MRTNTKKHKMTRPMTTKEYFQMIYHILCEKNKMPKELLEYGHAAGRPTPMTTGAFDLGHHLNYGESEGIYLDIWIEYDDNMQKQKARIGIFKTLRTDPEAMHRMAELLADFLIEGYSYVDSHLDDFTWEGVDVYPIQEDGIPNRWSFWCNTMEKALERKDKLLKSYPCVIVRDNVTRKETIYRCQTKTTETLRNK